MDRGEAGRRFADAAADLVTTLARELRAQEFSRQVLPNRFFTIGRVSHSLPEDGKCRPVMNAVEHWSS